MIGQKQVIKHLDTIIEQDRFPKFLIITGPKGSGKKELCKYIAEKLNVFWCFEPDCKVETVRNAIWNASKVYSPTMYVFADADAMSIQARNSLLKITEEPPKNAYFIMTLEDINNTLPTIRSRAVIIRMDSYFINELFEYGKSIGMNSEDKDIIAEVCSTPGDVKYLLDVGVRKFYDYVTKVFDNIAVVSGSNAFKISYDIALKDTDVGYDLVLFLTAFKYKCWQEYRKTKEMKLLMAVQRTIEALQKCSFKSANKQMIFDIWILAIREEWMQWM